MENVEDFHINYWGSSDLDYGKPEKPRRSIKRKLEIVLAFLFILAMLPLFTIGYSKLKDFKIQKVSELITTPTPTIAPTGTPKDIVAVLNTELRKILAMDDVRERFAAQGVVAGSSTPEELGALLAAEVAHWATVIKAANIRLD